MKLKGVEFVEVKELKVKAEIPAIGQKSDIYLDGKNSSLKVTEGGVQIYSWGTDNKLPSDMLALALSNGDLGNLLNTKKDFLYGTGIQLFKSDSEGNVKPFASQKARQTLNAWGINSMVRQIICSIVDCNFAPINISTVKVGRKQIKSLDPVTVRAAFVQGQNKITQYCTAPSWPIDTSAGHKVTTTPIYNPEKSLPESIYILREYQTGLPIYGRPIWWSIAEWVKLANRIPVFYNDSLDTEGNMGHVVRVAQDLLLKLQENAGVDLNGELTPLKKIQDALMAKLDKFLYGTGKQRRVVDTCIMVNGVMAKGIEFEPIKKSFTGKEYMDLYAACITAITNACGVLGGLAGVSDGQMNSGGGTEIRTAAEYQQFYRTPRIRAEITEFLNTHILPDFLKEIGASTTEDIYFDFGNVQLTTLTKDHTSNNQNTITGQAPKAS